MAWRLAGHPDRSLARTRQALALVAPGSLAAVSALTEQGEALRALGRPGDAAAAYADAAAGDELPGEARATLLRREAAALQDAGRLPEALERLRRAASQDPGQALRARIEALSAAQADGDAKTAAHLAGAARRVAERAGDHRALAELDLLAAARALTAGDPRRALGSARSARAHALEATDPVLYTGAAIAIAELAEHQGDRAGAYESLATGWVTLGDLVGRELARQTFEPPLIGIRDRWGPDEFALVKREYEARRRASRG